MNKNDVLKEVYYNVETGLGGRDKLFKAAKKLNSSITLKDVDDFLRNQVNYQITKQPAKQNYFAIIGEPDSYQMDLMFYDNLKKYNHGYGVVLICIEITSRKLFAFPMKNKETSEVVKATRLFLKQIDDDVSSITTDNGSEFISKKFNELFQEIADEKEKEIKHQYAEPDDHNKLGKINRAIRTLRTIINNYMITHNTKNWVDVLPKLVKNYNKSVNRMTGYAPDSVGEKEAIEIRNKEVARSQKAIKDWEKFSIGDRVRLLKDKGLFDKGTKQWTNEIYTIDDYEGFSFRVKSEAGNIIKKLYKPYELQLIDKTEQIGKPLNVDKMKKKIKIKIVEKKTKKELKVDSDLSTKKSKRESKPTQKLLESLEQKKPKKS